MINISSSSSSSQAARVERAAERWIFFVADAPAEETLFSAFDIIIVIHSGANRILNTFLFLTALRTNGIPERFTTNLIFHSSPRIGEPERKGATLFHVASASVFFARLNRTKVSKSAVSGVSFPKQVSGGPFHPLPPGFSQSTGRQIPAVPSTLSTQAWKKNRGPGH